MNRFLLGLLLVAGLGRTAFATAELTLVSGATTITIIDNGVGDTDPTVGAIATATNISVGAWTVKLSGGDSYSPGLVPDGIDVQTLTAACNDAGCQSDANALTVSFSDTDFTTPISNFNTAFSSTQTGPSATTQSAYVDTTDTLFGTGSLIGTIGPLFSPSGSGSAMGGGPSGSSYALTLVDVFTSTGPGLATFTVTGGNITGVPEPAAVVLFGTVLALYATSLRRKRKLSLEK
jgi:hypothetical protein